MRDEDKFVVICIYDQYERSVNFFATKKGATDFAAKQGCCEVHIARLIKPAVPHKSTR